MLFKLFHIYFNCTESIYEHHAPKCKQSYIVPSEVLSPVNINITVFLDERTCSFWEVGNEVLRNLLCPSSW
jgi:hypothetical protein